MIADNIELMEISQEIFNQQRRPRLGNANPERMPLAFWEWMVRDKYYPHDARKKFNFEFKKEDGPIWTFHRMGSTRTELPDGRIIHIGGEYEDFYDPDFCIYNDVTVFTGSDQFEIFGYPKEVFPPTDFHTSTLWNGQIFITGGLGYPDDRQSGFTPVYSLDLTNYQISQPQTNGEMPGWIYKHRCNVSPGKITVRGGEVFEIRNGKKYDRANIEDYSLDLASGTWQRITNRNWPHFLIRRMDNKLLSSKVLPEPEEFIPEPFKEAMVSGEKWPNLRFVANHVEVLLLFNLLQAEVIFEGNLPAEQATKIAEEICSNIEESAQSPCLLERLQF